jgi:translation initiation factor IF-1
MAREDALRVEAVIVRALQERLAMASLANGHRLLVRPVVSAVAVPCVGERVLLEVSPFDLSKGVILKVLK